MRKILVAVDDSNASRRVVSFVNGFFHGLDVEVIGVNVAAAPASWVPTGAGVGRWFAWPYPDITEPSPAAADAQEHDAEWTVESSGLEEDVVIGEVGDPVLRICRTAVEQDVDLIVVGTSHKGWWRRLLEGSVSADLQREAPRPVLIVQ